MLLILVKIALFHEILERDLAHFMLFAAIPFLARVGMNIYFSTTSSAKILGLAHFFREKLRPKIIVVVSLLSGFAILIAVWLVVGNVIVPTSFIHPAGFRYFTLSSLVIETFRRCNRRFIRRIH